MQRIFNGAFPQHCAGLEVVGCQTADASQIVGISPRRRKTCDAAVAKTRIQAYRVRKTQFRNSRSARVRTDVLLRTGGAAALTHGQETVGVAPTMLLAQCRAAAATLVTTGSADLDLALVVAGGSVQGEADPAFRAHDAPIRACAWAEAVWSGWLPRVALLLIVNNTIPRLQAAANIWANVASPGAAFIAPAWRLGWRVEGPCTVITDSGKTLELQRDSPAFVRGEI